MKKIILNSFIILILLSCEGDGDEPTPIPTPDNPMATILVFPEKNSECTEGTNKTTNESTILFKWNKSSNTDSYELVLKNLISGETTNTNLNSNQLSVELLRGTPYSWCVISKSSSVSKTAKSETWKFYNAGVATVSYAPFPAEAISPIKGSTITVSDNKVTLEWNASDVDNDIATFDVFFGVSGEVLNQLSTGQTSTNISNVSVNSKTSYKWYVITTDEQNNSSVSETFTFTLN